MENTYDLLRNIANKFLIQGEVTSIVKINKGYINSTYKVETLSKNNHIHQFPLLPLPLWKAGLQSLPDSRYLCL